MSAPMTLAVLVPFDTRLAGSPPHASPLGRAALHLRARGERLILARDVAGGVARGVALDGRAWVAAEAPAAAVWDRFPDHSQPEAWAQATDCLGRIPLGNPPELVRLCRDKLACQAVLEAAGVATPPVEGEPVRFERAVSGWGAAFLKPRHGALGRGVEAVGPGDPLPARGPGAVLGEDDALFVQRAVLPPQDLGHHCVRALVQRGPHGPVLAPMVVRRHATDPVVNVARGADAIAAEALLDAPRVRALERAALAAWEALDHGPTTLELGVDLVLDQAGAAWVIEVNGRPKGRLGALARQDPARFGHAELEATLRPLAALARAAAP